jgi:hypothetical protein
MPRDNEQPQRVSHPGRGSGKARPNTRRSGSLAAAESDLSPSATESATNWPAATGCFAPTWPASPHKAGQADAATTAYRTGTDTAAAPQPSRGSGVPPSEADAAIRASARHRKAPESAT